MRKLGVFLLFALIGAATAPQMTFAQAPAGLSFRSRSFINPFPQTKLYHLYVIGDGLAAGLEDGLQKAFKKKSALKIIQATRASYSIARSDRNNWPAIVDDLIKSQPMHIAVIMMGTNDVRSFRSRNGRYIRWGTDAWRAAYAEEVDALIKALKTRDVAVYWVGLPVMSNAKTSEAMAYLNNIFRERAYLNNVKFIDTWNGFSDQAGNFSAYGPDLTGQTRRLREPDGMSFTARGNRKLANYVEILLRRDLNEARAQRNIPLAGDDEEQARLIPETNDEKTGSKDENAAWMPEPNSKDGAQNAGKQEQPGTKTQDENKQTAKDEPVLPVLQPSLRPTAAPMGETIVGDMSEDVTALATVSPIADLNSAIDASERRLPISQRLYYKALVKGESLKPKPGRADDFKWPRS